MNLKESLEALDDLIDECEDGELRSMLKDVRFEFQDDEEEDDGDEEEDD